MKKLILFSLFILAFLYSQGQINLTNTTLQYFSPDNVTPLEAFLDVENNNNDSVEINIIRTIQSLTANHEETFCFGQYCYLPNTDTSLFPTVIYANTSEGTFKAHIDPLGYDGTDILSYHFYDIGNPSDSANITMEFVFSTTSVAENNKATFLKFNNPINNFAVLSYQLPDGAQHASVNFYNMLGNKVRSVNLEETQGAKVITTSELSNGIYILSMVVNDKISRSYKMVVNHN